MYLSISHLHHCPRGKQKKNSVTHKPNKNPKTTQSLSTTTNSPPSTPHTEQNSLTSKQKQNKVVSTFSQCCFFLIYFYPSLFFFHLSFSSFNSLQALHFFFLIRPLFFPTRPPQQQRHPLFRRLVHTQTNTNKHPATRKTTCTPPTDSGAQTPCPPYPPPHRRNGTSNSSSAGPSQTRCSGHRGGNRGA